MSLQNRAQQLGKQEHYRSSSEAIQLEAKQPISLAATPLFAIVDGELVNVLGTTDIPGMSPAYWCSDRQGISAPVSFREARVFPTAQEALGVLEQERSQRQPGLGR
jgi:hypothetical protein